MAVSHAALAASLPRLPADGRWTLGCLSEAQRPRPGLSPFADLPPPPTAMMPVALLEPLAVPRACFSVRLRHPDSRPFLKTLGSLSGPADGASSQPPGSQRREVAPKSAVPCRPGSDVW